MKSYDQLNLQGNLNSLEKIMRILKSKEKFIYIKKEIKNCEGNCPHSQEN